MPTKSMLHSDKLSNEIDEKHSGAHHETRTVSGADGVHSDQPTREDIAALAYQLWIERGSPHGSHEEDWHQAEQQLRSAGSITRTASA